VTGGCYLEAEDDQSLRGVVRERLIRGHPATAPTDEQVMQAVATRAAYDLEYAPVGYEDGISARPRSRR
jgi:hypothetical protein